jgi:hypothetical protein
MVIVDQATGSRATSQPKPEGPQPRLSGSRTAPSPGEGCVGSAGPCICSRTRMPMPWPSEANAGVVPRRGRKRTARRDSGRACQLHWRRCLGQFVHRSHRAAASALAAGESQPSSSDRSKPRRVPLTVCCSTMSCRDAPAASWHLGPWRLARLSNEQATDAGCRRGSGSLRGHSLANGGGGARSGEAGPRHGVASTFC